NINALIAFSLAVLPNVPGFLVAGGMIETAPAFLLNIYNYAWFVGAIVGGVLYAVLMRGVSLTVEEKLTGVLSHNVK
uniref:hypothetical protein n=1 Tax=Pseudomaricurvus sp. TaxID=2004510 RepID=UPI003F6D7394